MTTSTVTQETRWQRLMRHVVRTSRTVLRTGIDFALPSSCLCCGQEVLSEVATDVSLCENCLATLKPPPGPECQICAAPVGPYLDTKHGCIHCKSDRFHFDRIIRLGVYRDRLRHAVLRAKSVAGEPLARALADLLYSARSDDWPAANWDAIIPVPHFWTRRFVQQHAASETLAEQLSRRLRLPCDRGLLRKTRWTPAQAGSPPSVRRQQQKKAFSASKHVRGMKILLVDDVLTTGATADEAAKTLQAQGATSVTVAVIARGIGDRD